MCILMIYFNGMCFITFLILRKKADLVRQTRCLKMCGNAISSVVYLLKPKISTFFKFSLLAFGDVVKQCLVFDIIMS